MTFTDMLRDATAQNNSLLCVGLDPEPTRFPAGMQGDAHKIYDFCAAIVDATADLVCAFKPQIAYFAAHGAEDQLERLMQHMRANAPHVPVILDAKRGDIGSTAEHRALPGLPRQRRVLAVPHFQPRGRRPADPASGQRGRAAADV
jgi:orotidine-5'-phosphate decarboxylase